METQQMLSQAFEEGFAAAAVVDTGEIAFDPSFRPYCEENLCGQYGVNYSCPPDCGSPEEMRSRIQSHKKALVLQTIWEIPDLSDTASIKQAKKSHNAAQIRLAKRFRSEGCPGFSVGASGWALCTPCARAQGEPCRFPDDRYSCMSAYCIFVRKLTEKCGMEYNLPEGLLAFFGLYVFD